MQFNKIKYYILCSIKRTYSKYQVQDPEYGYGYGRSKNKTADFHSVKIVQGGEI